MQNVVNNSEDLTIVGIINPPEGSNTALALTAGINFTYALSEKSIDKASQSQIVKDQIAKPDVDVLTNKTFAEEKSGNSFDPSIASKLVEINPDAFKDVFNFDVSAFDLSSPNIDISPEQIEQIIASEVSPELIAQVVSEIATSKSLDESMQAIIIAANEKYLAYIAGGGTQS